MALGPLNNMNHLASYGQTMERVRKIMDPMGEYRRAMEATKPIDLLGTRRIMDQARLAMNPTAEFLRTMEQTKPVSPPASYERIHKIMDPMGEYRRAMEATKPVDLLGSRVTDQARLAMNPTAEARRALELTNPLASYSQTMEQTRRIMDPMGEYRRIMSDFSKLVGVPSPAPAEEVSTNTNAPPSTAPESAPFNPTLIAALLSVAWTCGWLIARGADAQEVGDLLLEAVGLAAYFYEQSKRRRSES